MAADYSIMGDLFQRLVSLECPSKILKRSLRDFMSNIVSSGERQVG